MKKTNPPTEIKTWTDILKVLGFFGVPCDWVQQQTGKPDKWIIFLRDTKWTAQNAIDLVSAHKYLRKIDYRDFIFTVK